MSLKSKWENLSVKRKIFITNSIFISVSLIVLYSAIYVFMPKVYQIYRINKINLNTEALRNTLNNEGNIDYKELLDSFSYNNNVNVIVLGEASNSEYYKIIYSSTRNGSIDNRNIPFGDNPNLKPDGFQEKWKDKFNQENQDITNIVYIKSIDEYCYMQVHIPVKPGEEATTIITVFFPFAIFAGILIALLLAMYYSRVVSRPLIKINKAAKRMSNLDFNHYLPVESNDEIGQLSNSLNIMSKNLKDTLEELENVNSKLTKDIEKERKIEKERREFIGTISHELKTPITIISGQIEGMIYGIGKYKDRDKYLKEAQGVVDNMKDLVRELLNLSERESDIMNINMGEVDIQALLNEILLDLNFLIEEKNLIVEKNFAGDSLILADRKLLKKAFINIIKNAVNYSPNNEKIIVTQNNKLINIENTGVTIAEKELKEVFNPFYRVDKSRNKKTGGTGLGLYIVKTILDKHENVEYEIISKENSVVFSIKFK